MNRSALLNCRLSHSGLLHSRFSSPAEVVGSLGAVQAQDFSAAKWALGLRVKNSTDEEIERTFNEGGFLRAHIMRPTWHFVLPEDLRWMTELTAPRVRSILASSNRKIGLDDGLFARSNAAIARALEGRNHLTRRELKGILADIGIETDVQRLAHILMQAELDGLICSGPMRGKQFTYALLDERVPEPAALTREEALERLANRYFRSHGPAQARDFSWWSGLAREDTEFALEQIRPEMSQAILNGRTYWYYPCPESGNTVAQSVFLLSIYDEYTIAYRDRSDLSDSRDIERMIAKGNALTAVIVIDGRVAGTWRKTARKNTLEIRLSPFRPLSAEEHEQAEAEVERYGRFFGKDAVIAEEPDVR